MRVVVLSLLLTVAAPTTSQARNAVQPAPPAALASELQAAELRVAEAERARFEAERKQWVLDARKDIEDASYSRLEIIIAALGGVLTLLVLVFGLSFGRQAASAARDEVRKELKELQEELVQARTRAIAAHEGVEHAREEANAARLAIEEVRKEAAELLKQIKEHEQEAERSRQAITDVARAVVATGSATPRETEQLNAAAADIERQPGQKRSPEDYEVLIGAAAAAEMWEDLQKATSAAIASYPRKKDLVGLALFANAYALSKNGKHAEALKGYDELIDRFSSSKIGAVKAILEAAIYNKACIFALDGDAQRAISALTAWLSMSDKADCKRLLEDSDLNSIRSHPDFRELLLKHGCVDKEKPGGE